MASIATLPSLLGMLAKFIGVVFKDGLPEDFFQKVIDDPSYRARFVAAEKLDFVLTPPVPVWRKIDDMTIEVNYDALPGPPCFKTATVEWRTPGLTGWHQVQRRGEDVFVDGRKVEFHFTEGQKTGIVVGHELRKQLEGQPVLHPNILDAMFENPHLIPESWKADEQGNSFRIYFWAIGYRNSDDRLYVRYLCWPGGRWRRYLCWLDDDFVAQDPAVVSAS